MNKDVEYYKVTLKNILQVDSKSSSVFAVIENDKILELLTGKRIYFANNESDFDVNVFNEGDFKLIGIELEKCPESDISKFLKFITNDKKESMLNDINYQEKSILYVLNKLDFYESSYSKKVKKHEFLRNY